MKTYTVAVGDVLEEVVVAGTWVCDRAQDVAQLRCGCGVDCGGQCA
jgi:hypothetical protein